MTGVYSSYAQAWQERAPHAVHRVETDRPHACPEVEVADAVGALDVRVVADRRREVAHETWHAEGGAVRLPERSLFARVEAVPGGLASVVASGVWANPEPYRLLRARRFRGWVEVPAEGEAPPFGTETAYRRVARLALHDQGGVVEVEGRGGPLTVELSRLLYGRSLEVLKLAVYEMPAAEVTVESHAAWYVWAEPESRRLGINAREAVTGWTLEASGLSNSDERPSRARPPGRRGGSQSAPPAVTRAHGYAPLWLR